MEYTGGLMKKIRNLILSIIIMLMVSMVSIVVLSILSYLYKWQADKALVGITITYILAGLIGGMAQKILNKEQKGIGQKMLDGILTGLIFVGVLWIVSIFITQNPFLFTTRFLMILMLVIGSTCLGRIL